MTLADQVSCFNEGAFSYGGLSGRNKRLYKVA
jgi:hypothetical protein